MTMGLGDHFQVQLNEKLKFQLLFFFFCYFSVWSLVPFSLLSISYTLHQRRIFCNKLSSASLELQPRRNGRWGSASDPWSAQREARWDVQHLQQEWVRTRFSTRQYINDLSFNIYISLMFEHWCVARLRPLFSPSLCVCLCSPTLHASPLWEASCWHSLQGVLLIFLERHCTEREEWKSYTVAADAQPSRTNSSKKHPAGIYVTVLVVCCPNITWAWISIFHSYIFTVNRWGLRLITIIMLWMGHLFLDIIVFTVALLSCILHLGVLSRDFFKEVRSKCWFFFKVDLP